MEPLTHVPAGETIPGSVHAVSVSIPDIASVVAFESHDEVTLRQIRRGYPRFRRHPYAEQVAGLVGADVGRPAGDLVLTCSERTARAAAAYGGLDDGAVVTARGVHAVAVPAGSAAAIRVKDHVQHTGGLLSSRAAEDVLLVSGLLDEPHAETACHDRPYERITAATGAAYGADPRFVSVHNTGMNGIHAAIAAIDGVQRARGRRRWLHLGWLFFDTVKLLEKGIVDATGRALPTAYDLDAIAAAVAEAPDELAGIVAEVPSNPLLQVPDLGAVRELADRAGAAVVVDATIATPHNVDVLPYADVACESMTKYATGSADVLTGVTVVNPASPMAEHLVEAVPRKGERPYVRDAARVADRLTGYEERVRLVNEGATALAKAMEGHEVVRHVHWPYEERSERNYRRLARPSGGPGGLLMIDLAVPLERVYDRLPVPKGPSFGAEFTMVSPQVFVAHFDLLSSARGRDELARNGLHRDMLRVSVGTEDPERIVAVFEEALHGAR